MSNPDKHKPLSAEELFKLLDTPSSKASDFDELDDFEKEALEGFSAHSNFQKAQALTEEINLAISKKSIDANKGGSKNKVIWFSAAASIVLIIMLSVFFFNQSKQDSQTNIALNETKEDKKPLDVQPQATAPLETISQSVVSNNVSPDFKNKEKAKQLEVITGAKKAEGENGVGIVNEPSLAYSENKPAFGYEKTAKDEAKNRNENDLDDLLKQADVLADKIEAKKKANNGLEQEQLNSEVAANQNISTTSAATGSTNNTKITKEEAGYHKADEDRVAITTKKSEKDKAAKQAVDSYDKANAGPGSSGKVASAPASVSLADNIISNPYYKGGELGIRNYVLTYLKEKQSLITIAGTYKIIGIVSTEGKLNISSIKQTTKVNCNCENIITEALNTMTKWNPAQEGGKDVSSNVEFTIVF